MRDFSCRHFHEAVKLQLPRFHRGDVECMILHGALWGRIRKRDTGLGIAATPGRALCVAAVKGCWMLLSLKSEPKENPALEKELCQATSFFLQL